MTTYPWDYDRYSGACTVLGVIRTGLEIHSRTDLLFLSQVNSHYYHTIDKEKAKIYAKRELLNLDFQFGMVQ